MSGAYFCSHCGDSTLQGNFNHSGRFICVKCEASAERFHFNTYTLENDQIIIHVPLSEYDDANQRAKFIDYCYHIFNQNLSKAAYPLMERMRTKNKYTWLGMLQAMEYHYIIKNNSIAKANNSIGIIPYVYDKAEQFYKEQNYFRYKKWEQMMKKAIQQTSSQVHVQDKKKIKQIDMSNL